MQTLIETYIIKYGKRDPINGGWFYTRIPTGSKTVEGDISIEEAESFVRCSFPDATNYNLFTIEPNGAKHWWLSSHV